MTWQLPSEPNAVRRLVRTLERDAPGPARVCCEAGPCGYALQRQVATARVSGQVIAPGENSTGEQHRRGRITRTGNALVRRLLVERRGTINIGRATASHTIPFTSGDR